MKTTQNLIKMSGYGALDLETEYITFWDNVCPTSKNAVCALQINCKQLHFPMEKSCRNKQTIIIVLNVCKNNSFSMEKDWSEIIKRLVKVSAMLYKWPYCVFTLYGRYIKIKKNHIPFYSINQLNGKTKIKVEFFFFVLFCVVLFWFLFCVVLFLGG